MIKKKYEKANKITSIDALLKEDYIYNVGSFPHIKDVDAYKRLTLNSVCRLIKQEKLYTIRLIEEEEKKIVVNSEKELYDYHDKDFISNSTIWE